MQWINRIYHSAVRFSGRRKNLRVFAVGILLIAVYAAWKYQHTETVLYLMLGIGFLALTGVVLPRIMRPLLIVWMTLTGIVGDIFATSVIFVIYFVLFTPLALTKRKDSHKGWRDVSEHVNYDKMY